MNEAIEQLLEPTGDRTRADMAKLLGEALDVWETIQSQKMLQARSILAEKSSAI